MGWQSTALSRGTSLCVYMLHCKPDICVCSLLYVCEVVSQVVFDSALRLLGTLLRSATKHNTLSTYTHVCTQLPQCTDRYTVTHIHIIRSYTCTHTHTRAHMHRHIYVPLTCQYHTSKLVSVRCKDVFSVGRLIIALLCVVCMCLVVCGMS